MSMLVTDQRQHALWSVDVPALSHCRGLVSDYINALHYNFLQPTVVINCEHLLQFFCSVSPD